MDSIREKYDTVIGLEVHIQLLTQSKAYATDLNTFGSSPNTNISPFTLGHPGTLPKANKKTIEYAVRLGLATHSDISRDMHFARKNYFYADLPKGYQITQDKTPICKNGYLWIKDAKGRDKKINLTRIHMEEDAGKSIHDIDPFNTLVDLNRAGVPLLEMVTEPELSDSIEASVFLAEVRKLVRFLEICDGNMEEGSLRCDANISVRPKGEIKLGNRVEVKNMNSLRNVKKAIDHEIQRQIERLEQGLTVDVETRSFDAESRTTFSLRSKELDHDYRYFPEPDLQPIHLTTEAIEKVKAALPALPRALYLKFRQSYGLSEYDAIYLTESRGMALFFETLAGMTTHYKTAANHMMGPVKSYLNAQGLSIEKYPLTPKHISVIISMIEGGEISNSAAIKKLYPLAYQNPDTPIKQLAEEHELLHRDNADEIKTTIREILAQWPEKVEAYNNGKKNLLGLFMGELMKATKGQYDPKMVNALLRKMLDEL